MQGIVKEMAVYTLFFEKEILAGGDKVNASVKAVDHGIDCFGTIIAYSDSDNFGIKSGGKNNEKTSNTWR